MSQQNRLLVVCLKTAVLVLTVAVQIVGSANAVPPNFVNETLLSGLTQPISIEFSPDNRMFVVGHLGTIWVALPGSTQLLSTPFITLPNIETTYSENGVFGMVFDPNFTTNGYFYVFFTANTPNGQRDRVSRFTASGNTANPASEHVIWEDVAVPGITHHGGSLDFGPDGNLYVSVGENYDANQAQMVDTFRGKILRMHPDGTAPSDNPFYVGSGQPQDYVWAMGLRNPFRIKFDDPTGRLFIGDVGGNVQTTAVEEVDLGKAGANYGWPLCEGPCSISGVTSPVFSYPHNGNHACITGGFVYRGSQFPSSYQGTYFYGDYVNQWIRRLTFDSSGNLSGALLFEPDNGQSGLFGEIVDLDQGPDGALYYVGFDYGANGTIRRIRYIAGNQPPVASASASPLAGTTVPLTVNFSSFGSFDPEGLPLSYSWDFGDGNTSNQANPAHAYQARGQYTVRLTVSDGNSAVLAAPLTIRVGNPPQPTINLPAPDSTFIGGDTILFSGTATDVEDGSLPASAFSWSVAFYHDGHIHPGFGPFNGVTSGSFQIPTSGHDFSGNTYYVIYLTVTDSDGISQTTTVSIYPRKVNLTLNTSPSGGYLDLDGIRQMTPFVLDDAIGFQHTVSAPDQFLGVQQLTFASWSDGGAQTHTITLSSTDLSLTATFNTAAVPPLFASTLDDQLSVLMPASGTGSNASVVTSPANDFVPAHNGNGLRIDAGGEYMRIVQTDGVTKNIELDKGAVEFWFKPTYNHTDGLKHYLFATGGFGTVPGGIVFLKNNTLNQNQLNVHITDANGAFHHTGVASNYYSWTAGQWVDIRMTWDTTIAGQNVHIYLNGTEVPAYAYASSGPFTMAAESSSQFIYFGQLNAAGTAPAGGIFDDVVIVGAASAPPPSTDTTPPVLSGGQPTGTLPSGTTSTTLSVLTNEACTCRYATTPNTAYASMPGTFAITGGTAHSSPISGLVDGTTYNYYVRCKDLAGNADLSDYPISFSVASPPADTTPPVLSGGQPTGILAAGTTSTTLSVVTNEACNCRYATTANTLYGSMTSTFAVTGATSHSTPISGLVNGTSYNYYVRCQDLAGNANLSDYPISFSVASSTPPPGMLLHSTLDDLSSVTTPAVGTGANAVVNTSPANDFVAGILGNGLRINAAGEYARFVQRDAFTQNVELDHGTVDFWFQPTYAASDGVRHTLLSIGTVSGSTVGIDIEKNNSLNANEFSIRVSNATGKIWGTGVPIGSYPWAAGQWVKIKVTWDFNSLGRPVRIYFNGTEASQYSYNTIPSVLTMGPESQTAYIYLGERTAPGTTPANGVIDELTIYDYVVP